MRAYVVSLHHLESVCAVSARESAQVMAHPGKPTSFERSDSGRHGATILVFAALFALGHAGASDFQGFFGAKSAQAAPLSQRSVYATLRACQSAKLLSDPECKNAFDNAEAELEEKSPRFNDRRSCENFFSRCMIGDLAGGVAGSRGKARGVSFIPDMRAVEITISPGGRTVRPLIDSKRFGLEFSQRTVTRQDTFQSGSKTARAQALWAQMQGAASRAEQPSSSAVVQPSLYDDPGPAAGAGNAASFPVPLTMLRDLKDRKKTVQSATLVW
jgi:hypothetical protein